MSAPLAPRVLVVGIDGVRHDLLAEVPMPRLAEVAEAGFLVPVEAAAGTPSMSGPCWATVVTGVEAVEHGVWGDHSPQDRTAWVACAGPGVPAGPPLGRSRHVDVAAQVCAALGRPIAPHRTPDGRPFPVARPVRPVPA
ncbi:alkaline phosphatase family protein [Kitasatospora sp. NBC_00315]|uniref:alkaline phosphatase family protein n=1 Tax=Kitasatospora sp. NBC_00315 TaxID=2975963 RepID=UPI00352E6DC3